jgi:hypothetical protein
MPVVWHVTQIHNSVRLIIFSDHCAELIDRPNDWKNESPKNRMAERSKDWRTEWQNDRMNDWTFERLIDRRKLCHIANCDRLNVWPKDQTTEWIERLNERTHAWTKLERLMVTVGSSIVRSLVSMFETYIRGIFRVKPGNVRQSHNDILYMYVSHVHTITLKLTRNSLKYLVYNL